MSTPIQKRVVTTIPKDLVRILDEAPVVIRDPSGHAGLIRVDWAKLKDAKALKQLLESKEITSQYEVVLMEK